MVKKKKSIKKSDPNASLWGWGDEEDVVASGENQVFIFVRFFIIKMQKKIVKSLLVFFPFHKSKLLH